MRAAPTALPGTDRPRPPAPGAGFGRRLVRILLLIVSLVAALGLSTKSPFPSSTAEGPARTSLPSAPAGYFLENAGQLDPRVRYQLAGEGVSLQVADDGLWVTIATDRAPSPTGIERDARIHLTYADAGPATRVEPFGPRPAPVTYLRGSAETGATVRATAWLGVRYVDIFPGVDLELTAPGGRLRQDVVVRDPEDGAAAPRAARLRVAGADGLSVEEGTRLRLETAAGPVRLDLPRAIGAPDLTAGTGPIVLSATEVAAPFVFAAATPAPFTPAGAPAAGPAAASDLIFGTYLGRSRDDVARGLVVDAAGALYVAGYTYSADFPVTTGAFSRTLAGSADAYIAKLAADGSRLEYLTFLGGSDNDQANGLAVDATGRAFVVGTTRSRDFPTTAGAFQRVRGGGEDFESDAFVAALNQSGTALIYATYLGGAGEDRGLGIAVDAAGNAYAVGQTRSADFPTTPNGVQRTFGGVADGFVAKLGPSGFALGYATYLGGSGLDEIKAIAVDGTGSAHVAGTTFSSNLPVTPGSFLPVYNGFADAFVAKLAPFGNSLTYLSYLGGGGDEKLFGLAIDGAGAAYLTGQTRSTNFPTTPGVHRRSLSGSGDAFVTKVSADGRRLVYSTFLGGFGDEWAEAVAVDRDGNAHVTGSTSSDAFPATARAVQPARAASYDAFAATLNATGAVVLYGTFLGGARDDVGTSIGVGPTGDLYVAGYTGSIDFPTTARSYQPLGGGGIYPIDAWAARIRTGLTVIPAAPAGDPELPYRLLLPVLRRTAPTG